MRQFLRASLIAADYEILEAVTGESGLNIVAQCAPDVILLDLGLPDMDGLEVVSQIRTLRETPILVLSSRQQQQDKVAALESGADDYMTKPIGLDELHARIRVALRHARTEEAPAEEPTPTIFNVSGLRVDLSRRKVTMHEKELRLTSTEYKLLAHLVKNAGEVVKHSELSQAVWGPDYGAQTNHLRVYIKHLRNKLEVQPNLPQFILTAPGVGYMLVGR